MKERNCIIRITNFDAGYIFKRLLTPDKSLRSSGTESRVHENDLLLYHDVLDNRDSQWQKLTYLAPSKTRQVSAVDV